MKVLRRSIIAICIFLLLPVLFNLFSLLYNRLSTGKYYTIELKNEVKSGAAQVIEVNKKMKIDNDTLIVRRIINTDKNTYVILSYIPRNSGWSFPFNTIKLYDDQGIVNVSGAGGQGGFFREDFLTKYDRVNTDCKEITLKYEWYDRNVELKIPCRRSGKI